MITSVEGKLTDCGIEWVDIEIGGVTLRASVPQSTIGELGQRGDKIRLFTSLQIRDDGLTLYGFPSQEARSVFGALVGVNGVGPRLALSVLSSLSLQTLALAIESGDTDVFKGVAGVGSRIANRIILELSGKLDIDLVSSVNSQDDGEAINALTALGYATSEAIEALSFLPPNSELSVEDKVRLCLQRMGSR